MQTVDTLPANWLVEPRAAAVHFGLGLLGALVILLVGLVLAQILARVANAALLRTPLRRRLLLVGFLTRAVRITIIVFAGVLALGKLGVNLGPLIAGIGITGFVVGFAFKDSLSNLAAGLLLLIYEPFEVGDFVEIGGITGSVLDLSVAATEMREPDGRLAIMPNSKIWNAPIINYNRLGQRRVQWTVKVAADADVSAALTAVKGAVIGDSRVLADPPPQLLVGETGESVVELIVRVWVAPMHVDEVAEELRGRMKQALDAHGVAIKTIVPPTLALP